MKLWPGKSERQKQQLEDEITASVMKILHYGEESVSVAFEEINSNDWAAKVYQPEVKAKWNELYKRPGYTL